MKFRVSSDIFESFPGLCLGVVYAKGILNGPSTDELKSRLTSEVKRISSECTPESIDEDPRFIVWREAFRSFKAKPKKYKCSVENLYRMIAGGVELGSINALVDVYNIYSLKYGLPLGGDDVDKVDGDITLRFASGDETFVQLNSKEESSPKPGEVIYADDKEVLCRRWNWRECDKSKMTEDTKNACLVIEGLPPFTGEQIGEITAALAKEIEQYCGGSCSFEVLSSSKPELNLG